MIDEVGDELGDAQLDAIQVIPRKVELSAKRSQPICDFADQIRTERSSQQALFYGFHLGPCPDECQNDARASSSPLKTGIS